MRLVQMTLFKMQKVPFMCEFYGIRINTIQQYEEHLNRKIHSDLNLNAPAFIKL